MRRPDIDMHAFRRCRGMRMAVFDMAGTVIEEGGAVYKTLYETMRAFGLSVGPRDVDGWHGASKYEVLDHFLVKESTVGEFAQRQRDLHRLFEDNLKQTYFSRNAVKLIDPSVPQLFEGMRLNGTKVALNTGYSSDIQLDVQAHTVTCRGQPLNLTRTEFELLHFFMANEGKALSHRLILQNVWGPEYGNEAEYLRVYIGRLRRKIEPDPSHPVLLKTEYGVGYRFG